MILMLKNLWIVCRIAYLSVFSNWSKNKVIVSIMAISFALIQVLLSISEGFGLQVKNFALDSLVGHMKIMTPQYKKDNSIKNSFFIEEEVLNKIRAIDGVRGVTKRILIPAVIKSERNIKNAILVGIDINNEKDLSFIGKEYGYTKFSDILQGDNILIGEKLLAKLATNISYKVVLSGQNFHGKLLEKAYFTKDIFHSNLPSVENIYIFANIIYLADVYSLNNRITEVSILLYNDQHMDSIYKEIATLIPSGTVLYQWKNLMPFLSNWLEMMYINILVFFAVVFFAAIIPLANTLLISVLERTYQFGILQALGLKKTYLALLIIIEAKIILFIGILIGTLMGLLISYLLQYSGIDITPFAKGAANLGLGSTIYPKINIINTLYMAFIMYLLGVISSIYPAFRSALYSPTKALTKRT